MKPLRILSTLLLCFLTVFTVTAQKVSYSKYDKFDLRNDDFSVIGKINGKIYVYRTNTDGYYLDAYNDNMERQATVVLDFFPKKIYETRFIAYSNKVIILYQAVESNSVIQYAALLNDKGMLIKDPIKLDEVKAGFFGPNRNYFSSAVSDDKKQILVYAANDKGSELQFRGRWLDDQLNIEHVNDAGFKADNDVQHGEGILSNDGNFYIPVYTPVGGKEFSDQLWLLNLTRGASKFTPIEVPLNQKYAAGTYMKMDNPNKRIYIGGFYSEKKNGNYDGVLYAYLDLASGTFQSRKNIAFDEQTRLSTGERSKKRALNNYIVREMIVKNNGGFVMVSEDFLITTRNGSAIGYGYSAMYPPSMSSSIREYHYGDILVMSYNGEGIREWNSFIRKDQYSQEDGGIFSSYYLVNTGGTLGFVFNDFASSRTKIKLASIDEHGKMEIKSLPANGNDEPDWLPRSGKQVATREMVVPCLMKRQICFAKIEF